LKYLLFSFITLLFGARVFADPYPKNFDIDIQHYQFRLILSDQHDSIYGEASILINLKKEGISRLRFDLTTFSADLRGRGMRVLKIVGDKKELLFSHQNNELFITIPESTVNQKLTVTISYVGIPDAGLLIKPNHYNDRTFFSDNWPNLGHHWLPLVDHPYDKATCEFIVTAPAHYKVISNGLLQEESSLPDGNKLTHWKQSVPIAPWLFVLGVADFAVQYVDDFKSKSIQTWVFYQDREAGFYDFATPTKKALSFFSEYIGPFAYEKLANIQSNNSTGGMEAASAIMYSEKSVSGKRDPRWQNVIVHEIAHQWFGDAVTESDWDHVWLSEGFATYFTLLFTEYSSGHDAFIRDMNASRESIKKYLTQNTPSSVVHHQLSDMQKVTSTLTYQKGAWALHMLRYKTGDEDFNKGIRSYYKKYFNGHATTDDFRNEMELASGKDLKNFFTQWLDRTDIPKIKGQWKWNEKTKEITIAVEQLQGGSIYTIPLEFGFVFPDQPRPLIQSTEWNQRTASFTFKLNSRPAQVSIDPQTTLLADFDFQEKGK